MICFFCCKTIGCVNPLSACSPDRLILIMTINQLITHKIRIVFILFWLLMESCQQVTLPESASLYPVQVGNRYGYIDKQGVLRIPAQFFSVMPFSEGRALVEYEPGKKLLIDQEGRIVFQDTSGYLRGYFQCGLIRFDTKSGQSCFIDTLGHIRFCLSDSIEYAHTTFSDERLLVRYQDRRFAYLDTNGQVVFEIKRGFPAPFSEGLARIQFSQRTCYVDVRGRRQFCVLGMGDDFHSGLALVKQQERLYFVDKKGRSRLQKLPYDAVSPFSEGYARVDKQGRAGFINTNGEEVLPLIYDQALPFSSGLAAVRQHGKPWQFVRVAHAGITNLPLTQVTLPGFQQALAYVQLDSVWGYINQKGELVWQQQ